MVVIVVCEGKKEKKLKKQNKTKNNQKQLTKITHPLSHLYSYHYPPLLPLSPTLHIGCGAYDPDCEIPGQVVFGCGEQETCLPVFDDNVNGTGTGYFLSYPSLSSLFISHPLPPSPSSLSFPPSPPLLLLPSSSPSLPSSLPQYSDKSMCNLFKHRNRN